MLIYIIYLLIFSILCFVILIAFKAISRGMEAKKINKVELKKKGKKSAAPRDLGERAQFVVDFLRTM